MGIVIIIIIIIIIIIFTIAQAILIQKGEAIILITNEITPEESIILEEYPEMII